jgi:predicted Ser/Thr protein kinase
VSTNWLGNRYRILRKLGEGKMGQVYLVEHVQLKRVEAVKVLLPSLAATPELVARFRREAKVLNQVQHPNIVGVFDFGRLPAGEFFLAMEYADGQNLRTALRQAGRFPPARALAMLRQIADAADHAHKIGVVHRDLKPDNMVLVEHRGQPDVVKILDFGLARITRPDYRDSVGATLEGAVLGAPGYMAPEQVKGAADLDHRCDLYAIGCIAFELLTGTLPFTGGVVNVMNAHLAEVPPRPSERVLPGELSAEIDAVVLRCLEKAPAARFQSGRELRDAIDHLIEAAQAGTRRSSRDLKDALAATAFGGAAGGPVGGGMTDTLRAGPDSFEAAAETAAMELIEALVNAGCSDFQLVVGLSHLRELDSELQQLAAEVAATEQQTAAVEQRDRERLARLRFALGELCFARDQATSQGQAVAPVVEEEITHLERRIAQLDADLDAAIGATNQRCLELGAEQARIQDDRGKRITQMERLATELARAFLHVPAIADLTAQLRALAEVAGWATVVERR